MSNENLSTKKASQEKKPVPLGEKIRALLFLVIFGLPVVYGISHVVLSGTINRAFNHPQQCTITAAVAQRSGSKSYSSSSNIYIGLYLRIECLRAGKRIREVIDERRDLQPLAISTLFFNLLHD